MRRILAGALTLAGALLPGAAAAHGSLAGGNDFLNGALHPLFVPAHLLTLAAAGLWFGRQSLDRAGPVLLAFAGALAAGLAASLWAPVPQWHETALLALALAAGVATAAAWPPRRALAVPGLAAAGLLVGLDSPPDWASGGGVVAAAAGTFLGAYLLFLNVAGLASIAKRPWQAIAARIAGSWITAIALIVLALSLRP